MEGQLSSGRMLPETVAQQEQAFMWRNYFAHAFEGAAFIGGLYFVAADTVLPALFKQMGAPSWLIGLIPVSMMVGFVAPGIFVAHIADRLERSKPFILRTGILQRIPYLVSALMLLFASQSYPTATLIAVAVTPFLSGLFGGISGPAWMEMTSRVLPGKRRTSSLALRMGTASVIGIFAGQIVQQVLSNNPGPEGYGILHLYAFMFLCISYLIFLLQYEEPVKRDHRDTVTLKKNISTIPELFKKHPKLMRFMLMRGSMQSIWLVTPFMALYACQELGREAEFVGTLISAQMPAMLVGTIFTGYMGDKFGSSRIMRIMVLGEIIALCCLFFCTSTPAFIAVFMLWAACAPNAEMSGFSAAFDVVPKKRRATALGMLGLCNAPFMMLFGLIGGLCQQFLAAEGEVTLFVPIVIALVLLTPIVLFGGKILDQK